MITTRTTYRLARPGDYKALHRLAQAQGQGGTVAYQYPTIVVERDGHLVGFAATQRWSKRLMVGPVVVADTVRLKGLVAIRAVLEIEKVLKAQGYLYYLIGTGHPGLMRICAAFGCESVPSEDGDAWYLRRLRVDAAFTRAARPFHLPPLLAWADAQHRRALERGAVLTRTGLALARRVGVAHPERVRVLQVQALPWPTDPALWSMVQDLGMLPAQALTLGAAVLVCAPRVTAPLLAHEFRHVAQCEQAGGLAAFLPRYLAELAQYGYDDAPLEQDACEYERRAYEKE